MTPRPTTVRRRLGLGALTIALTATAVGMLPDTASAFGGSKCDPAPQTDTSFCVLDEVTFDDASSNPTTLANEKVGLDLSWTNYSTGLASAKSDRWLSSLGFTSGNATTAGPIITPGSDLDANLLVGGFPTNADNCAAGSDNSFSSCTAGSGTADIEVTDQLSNVSVREATVGVHRIVSVTPSDPSVLADYEVTLEIYSPASAVLNAITINATEHLVVNADTGSGVSASMSVQGTDTGSLGESYDWSLASIHLQFERESGVLADGSTASQTFTLAHLSDTCIPQAFSTSATSRGATALTIPADFATTGCPSAPTNLTATGQLPFRGIFSASAAKEGGRPLAAQPYLWDFGDGSTDQTAGASTAHKYSDASDRDITLTAIDQGGAKSDTVTVHFNGSRITFGPPVLKITYGHRGTATGTLSDYVSNNGLGGRSVAVYTCDPSSAGRHLAGTGSTSSTGAFTIGMSPRSAGLYCADFKGEDGRIGVESLPIQVQIRYAVTLTSSKSTVTAGRKIRLFGSVSPTASGDKVRLQRRVHGHWKTIKRIGLDSSSDYSTRVRVRGTAKYAKFRVIKPKSADYLRGHSPVVKVRITR